MNKHACAILITLSTFLPCVLPCFAQEKIKVGAILPLSGAYARVGIAMQQGMQLALEESPDRPFHIIYEDDVSVTKVPAVNATKKLTDLDKVDVLINSAASTVSAIAPIIKQKNTPTLVLWDSNKKMSTISNLIFGFGYSNELAGEDMATFAYNNLKAQSVAVITAQDEWSEIVSQSFKDAFQALGGNLILDENISGEETDLRTLVLKIKSKKALAIYAPLWGVALQNLIKQAREIGYTAPILSADALVESDLEQLGGATENLYATQVYFADQSFADAYAQRFNEKSSGMNLAYVALGYDSIKCLLTLRERLSEQNTPFDKEAIKANLPSLRFQGLLGDTSFNDARMVERREPILKAKGKNLTPVTL